MAQVPGATVTKKAIISPVVYTNSNTPYLIYQVSAGTVVVTVDGFVVNKVSGNALGPLDNGSHTVRVEVTDDLNQTAFDEVTFTVDTTSTGMDDTNIYCMGTGTYLVGPSNFTNGISVPSSNNDVWIDSPIINGTKAIIKGAMDNTIPVMGVIVQVTNASGTATYPVAVSGKYFAAQVPLALDFNTITVIATDQNSAQHQATVTVTGASQTETVELQASPNTGIPTLKPGGQTTLDVFLATTASIQYPVANYSWDFNGTGGSQLTCYSHSNVTASYEQVGLYLTAVTVTDAEGNHFTDTVIVNVVDKVTMETLLAATWNGMREAVIIGNIPTALSYLISGSRDRYNAIFTNPARNITARLSEINRIEINSVQDMSAECVAIRQESDGEYAYPLTFVIDENGMWKILGF